VHKRLLGQREARARAQGAIVGGHLGEQSRVVLRIGDDGHAGVVLGRRTDHRRTADVDVLDRLGQRDVGLGNGFAKGVEIHAHQIDGRDAVACDRRHVLGQIAARQDAGVHLRMQGLDAAVEHFREARVIADLGDRQAGVAQQLERCRRWTAV
jgi:hypothetical protein